MNHLSKDLQKIINHLGLESELSPLIIGAVCRLRFPDIQRRDFGKFSDVWYSPEANLAVRFSSEGIHEIASQRLALSNLDFLRSMLSASRREAETVVRLAELLGVCWDSQKNLDDPKMPTERMLAQFRELWGFDQPDGLVYGKGWRRQQTGKISLEVPIERLEPHPKSIRRYPRIDQALLDSDERNLPDLVVVPGPSDVFWVVCGSRRLGRAKLKKQPKVSVCLRFLDGDEIYNVQFEENANRLDFDPFETALGMQSWAEELKARGCRAPKRTIAEKRGIDPADVSRYLKLLSIPEEHWETLHPLPLSRLVALAVIKDPDKQETAIKQELGANEEKVGKEKKPLPKRSRLSLQVGESKFFLSPPAHLFPEDADELTRVRTLREILQKREEELVMEVSGEENIL